MASDLAFLSAEPPTDLAQEPETDTTAWSATFLVEVSAGELPDSEERKALRQALTGRGPVVVSKGSSLMVTFDVFGTPPQVQEKAVAEFWNAVEAADCHNYEVVDAQLVSHADLDECQTYGKPLEYYGVTECAMALEVSKQRIEQLISAGEFPPVDAVVGTRSAWRPESIRRYAFLRRRKRAKRKRSR